MSDIDTPLEQLAGELGAVAGRIEREVDFRVTAAIADINRRIAEAELRMATLAVGIKDGEPGARGEPGEKGLDGSPGEPGRPGTPAELTVVPDDIAEQISKAIAVLKETAPSARNAVVLNIHSPVAPKKNKTITTHRDREGNLVAEVHERD